MEGCDFCSCFYCKGDACAYGSQAILCILTVIAIIFSVASALTCEFVEIFNNPNITLHAGLFTYENRQGSCVSIPDRIDTDVSAQTARIASLVAPCLGIIAAIVIVLLFFLAIPAFFTKCAYGWLFVLAIVAQGLTFLVFNSKTYCSGTLLALALDAAAGAGGTNDNADNLDPFYLCEPGSKAALSIVAMALFAICGLVALCAPQPRTSAFMRCVHSAGDQREERRQEERDQQDAAFAAAAEKRRAEAAAAAAAAAAATAERMRIKQDEMGHITIVTADPKHTVIDYRANKDDGTVTVTFGIVPKESADASAAAAAVDDDGVAVITSSSILKGTLEEEEEEEHEKDEESDVISKEEEEKVHNDAKEEEEETDNVKNTASEEKKRTDEFFTSEVGEMGHELTWEEEKEGKK